MSNNNENGMVYVQMEDYTVQVDEETSRRLNSDLVFASSYLEFIKNQIHNSNRDKKEVKEKVWKTSKCQTENYREATLQLIALRKKYDMEFKDKKTPKNNLWTKIASTLNEIGYIVGEGTEGRDRCRQKFANLQSAYMKCIDKRRQTGEGKVVDSPYFDELNDILGDKHVAKPVLLIDSIKSNDISTNDGSVSYSCSTECSTSPTADEISSTPSTSSCGSDSRNRFNNIKKTVRPKKDTNIERIIEMNNQNRENRKYEFNSILELMREQNNQRHSQIMALLSATRKSKKRARSS